MNVYLVHDGTRLLIKARAWINFSEASENRAYGHMGARITHSQSLFTLPEMYPYP